MKRLQTLLLALALLCAVATPVTFTGCATGTQQENAIRTHKDVWTVTKAAYDAWCERVVKPGSTVTPAREAIVDAAWNKFRAAYRQSLLALKGNTSAPPSPGLAKLSTDLLAALNTP